MPSCSSRPPVWAFEELLQLFPLHGKQFSVLEGKVSGALGVSSVTLSLNHFLDIREEKLFVCSLRFSDWDSQIKQIKTRLARKMYLVTQA